jgi:hypothetical protein
MCIPGVCHQLPDPAELEVAWMSHHLWLLLAGGVCEHICEPRALDTIMTSRCVTLRLDLQPTAVCAVVNWLASLDCLKHLFLRIVQQAMLGCLQFEGSLKFDSERNPV